MPHSPATIPATERLAAVNVFWRSLLTRSASSNWALAAVNALMCSSLARSAFFQSLRSAVWVSSLIRCVSSTCALAAV